MVNLLNSHHEVLYRAHYKHVSVSTRNYSVAKQTHERNAEEMVDPNASLTVLV